MLWHFQVKKCASAYKPPVFLALTSDRKSHALKPTWRLSLSVFLSSHAHLLSPSHHPFSKTLIKSCVALMNNRYAFISFGVNFDLALS